MQSVNIHTQIYVEKPVCVGRVDQRLKLTIAKGKKLMVALEQNAAFSEVGLKGIEQAKGFDRPAAAVGIIAHEYEEGFSEIVIGREGQL